MDIPLLIENMPVLHFPSLSHYLLPTAQVVKILLTEYSADSETEGVVKFDGHVIEGATALWCAILLR